MDLDDADGVGEQDRESAGEKRGDVFAVARVEHELLAVLLEAGVGERGSERVERRVAFDEHADACFAAGRMIAKKDKAEAKAFYADLCQRLGPGVKGYCDEYKKLGGDPKTLKKGGGPIFPPSPAPPKKDADKGKVPDGPSVKK